MPKPAKIAIVIPKYGTVGGGEGFARYLTNEIAQYDEFDLHVLANQWRADNDNITFHKIPIIHFPKWCTTVSFAYFVKRHLNRTKYDLVHTHERIFSANVFSAHSIPHAIWIRNVRHKSLPSLFDWATMWVERRMYANDNLQFVLPVSSLSDTLIRNSFELSNKQVKILPPGIDLRRFKRDKISSHISIHKQFGLSSSIICVLFVGMNFELKGLRELIEAVAMVRSPALRKRIKIIVAGRGNNNKFLRIAEEAGIGEHLVFIGVRNDMENVYRECDFSVLLSSFDTFGMVVAESMASSKPVIVSENVGAQDIITQGINGFICSKNAICDIRDRIETLCDAQIREKMGQEAEKSVQKLSWGKLASQMVKIYRESIMSNRKNHVNA